MSAATPVVTASGSAASGIPPIDCPSWCTDPGHVAEYCREDQICYSYDTYVTASLEEVEVTPHGVCESQIGAMACRGFNKRPVVLVHVIGFRDGIDVGANLTAAEARQLAEYLTAAADLICEGAER